jgi:hypothetical protein
LSNERISDENFISCILLFQKLLLTSALILWLKSSDFFRRSIRMGIKIVWKSFILEIIAVFAIGLHGNRPKNSPLIGFF